MKIFGDNDPDNDLPIKDILEQMSDNKLFNKKFLEQRKIFLWGAVMDESARDIVNRLLYLDADKPGEEIKFYINSPGRMVTAGMVIYDVMNMISSPVSTICMGHAASMGSIILSAGAKGSRYIFPTAEVMIHQPSIGGYFQSTAVEIEIEAKQIMKIKKLSAEILAKNCGQSYEKIMKDFDRDYWMNANEAVAYGIVDKVIDKII